MLMLLNICNVDFSVEIYYWLYENDEMNTKRKPKGLIIGELEYEAYEVMLALTLDYSLSVHLYILF